MPKKINVGRKTADKLSRCLDTLTHGAGGKKSLPRYMPDGSVVNTLEKVAVMTGTSEYRAAMIVMDSKEATPRLRREARGVLKPAPKSDQDGIAIMLWPSSHDAAVLRNEVSAATPAKDLHITLGYYGDVGSEDAPSKDELIRVAKTLAGNQSPFTAAIGGLTRFSGDETDPIVLNIDSPEVEDLRTILMNESRDAVERNHGYTPHMTIGYLSPDADMPLKRYPGNASPGVWITDIVVGYGDEYIMIPLNTSESKDVHTGSVPGTTSRGFGKVYREERIIQRMKRHKPKTVYGIELAPNDTNRITKI